MGGRRRRRRRAPPHTLTDNYRPDQPEIPIRAGGIIPMTTPDQTDRAIPVRRGHRAVRLTLICLTTAAAILLGASIFLSSR